MDTRPGSIIQLKGVSGQKEKEINVLLWAFIHHKTQRVKYNQKTLFKRLTNNN
jgi:hypothetical protein